MRKIIFLLFGIILIIGCATGYDKYGFLGGYEDRIVEEDIFEVSFAGNGFVQSRKAEDLALLRCASITLERKYKYFIVLDRLSQKQFFNIKPVTTILIQCFSEKPEAQDKEIYEAEKIKGELESKYKIAK
jgi:hypothetical protein